MHLRPVACLGPLLMRDAQEYDAPSTNAVPRISICTPKGVAEHCNWRLHARQTAASHNEQVAQEQSAVRCRRASSAALRPEKDSRPAGAPGRGSASATTWHPPAPPPLTTHSACSSGACSGAACTARQASLASHRGAGCSACTRPGAHQHRCLLRGSSRRGFAALHEFHLQQARGELGLAAARGRLLPMRLCHFPLGASSPMPCMYMLSCRYLVVSGLLQREAV